MPIGKYPVGKYPIGKAPAPLVTKGAKAEQLDVTVAGFGPA